MIIPPATAGSIGDYAMIDVLIREINHHKENQKIYIEGTQEDGWKEKFGSISMIHIDSNYGLLTDTLLALKLLFFDYCLVLGADVMDGKYGLASSLIRLRIADLSARIGVKTAILGFSWSKNPHINCVKKMKQISSNILLFARDRESFNRLNKLSLNNLTLTTDLAFLTKVNTHLTDKNLENWVFLQKSENYILIGLNLNHHTFPDDMDVAHVLSNVQEKLRALYKELKTAFLLLPHDDRGINNDWVLARKLLVCCEYENFPIYLPESLDNPQAVYHACQQLDMVITGRMHLGILSITAGTPVIIIEYQDKAEGLFKRIGCDDYRITPIEFYGRNSVDRVADLVRQRESAKHKIVTILPALREESEKQLNWL